MLIDFQLARRCDAPHFVWGRQKQGWQSHAWFWDKERWLALCGQHPMDSRDGKLRTTLEMRSEGPICAICEQRYNETWTDWWDTHAQTSE